MTLWEGIRLYPKALGWAALISLCCAMAGYDIALIGNFYAFPPFNRKYGELQPDGSYQVAAKWQAGISNSAQCGEIIGLIRKSPTVVSLISSINTDSSTVTGIGVERIGFRPFILATLTYQCAITTISFVAPNIETLVVYEVFAGIAFGVFMSSKLSTRSLSQGSINKTQSPYLMPARSALWLFEVTSLLGAIRAGALDNLSPLPSSRVCSSEPTSGRIEFPMLCRFVSPPQH